MAKKKEVKKSHRHKWQTDVNDCPNCGGCEIRWCQKEGCYVNQFRTENKWEDE